MAVQGGEDVYATLLLSDSYLPGALVLAHSLRDAATAKKLAVLVTLDSVSAEVVTQLQTVYDYVLPVPRIRNGMPANLYLMNRADLHSAFTKINLWKQTQFRRIVYIDADVVAYRAPDELFDLPHPFSAAPDIGWPDLFNTGVMALTPNMGDYYAMMAMAERGISFDGADQGLLNLHFKDNYHRLSFTYNVTPSAHYQYIPAYKHFQSSISMVHFIGTEKPWFQGRASGPATGSPFDEMVGRWWAVYDRHYRVDESTPDARQQVPELVQYFVKGEYQPRISYIVPVGQLPLAQEPPHQQHPATQHGTQDEGQQYSYQQSSSEPPQHQPSPSQQQQHYHHHYAPSQQPGSTPQPPDQHIPAPSVSFASNHGTQAEAPPEQVSGAPYGTPERTTGHPEHKPEPSPVAAAAQSAWDAQRQPPPQDSKPEAMNFPQTHYSMSSDPAPFVPPERYPTPPKNMWYEVPNEPPALPAEKPRPIFPWEGHQPRASRVFAKDEFQFDQPATGEILPEPSGQSVVSAEGPRTPAESYSVTEPSSAEQKSEPTTPTTPTIRVVPSDPWTSFTRTNAWDDVPEIERYVDTLQRHRRRKSRDSATGLRLDGRGFVRDVGGDSFAGWNRRGSKVTDFPSKDERPSLPVTPAPIHRVPFWGGGHPGDDDLAGEGEPQQSLPAAEGVPAQTDWDPVAQLQKLAKQQSDLLLQKLGGAGKTAGESSGGGQGTHGSSRDVFGGPLGGPLHTAGGRQIPTRSLPFGSENFRASPTYVTQTPRAPPPPVVSPTPVKPGPAPASFFGEQESAPEALTQTILEPSYQGPGTQWEKDEEIPTYETPALPTEEEMDILEE